LKNARRRAAIKRGVETREDSTTIVPMRAGISVIATRTPSTSRGRPVIHVHGRPRKAVDDGKLAM
jgi:hypothetical protein